MPRIKSHTINITQKILDKATPEDSGHCVIAQAVRKLGGKSVRVTAERVLFNLGGLRHDYPLPARAAVELVKFDRRGKKAIGPFKFVLSANTGTAVAVEKRKPQGPYKPRKKRGKKKGPRFCKRRFHGLRVIEVPVEH